MGAMPPEMISPQQLGRLDEIPSPATTPGSLADEEKFLVPILVETRKLSQWQWRKHVPYAILSASILEFCLQQTYYVVMIIFYIISDESLQKLLRFEPNKLSELWRFFTYMLLHEDWLHLLLNVTMQILFASFLELPHGKIKILILYLFGGITGVLGASCFHPDLVIGASGGVYALLISHVADILMNFETMKYKLYRCICITIIVISDIAYNLIHIFSNEEPFISWGAHVIGGISGLLLGLVLFKKEECLAKARKLSLFWTGFVLYIILLISLVILTSQVKKCTPKNIITTRYIYFC